MGRGNMNRITVHQLQKTFDGQKNVLEPVNLEIQEGEFVVLVGPSGCGKTTFLRLLAGLEEASQGSIFIDNEDITHVQPKDRGVAMVFQNYALYPHLSVFENLMYPLNILSLKKSERENRVSSVAKRLEIDTLLNRKPAQLSGGQKQRVAIGRALVREPKLFLFDEPLSNLDARLREQMRLEIARLHQELKRTTLYVTHDQHEAMTLGNRLILMNQGRILQIGKPLELYQNPQNLFVAKFLGNPSINTFLCSIKSLTECIGEFGKIEFKEIKIPQTQKEIILAIRPEHISITSTQENYHVKGTIKLIEHLGGESRIYVKIGKQEIVVIDRNHVCNTGESIFLSLNESQILWFENQEEGNRL